MSYAYFWPRACALRSCAVATAVFCGVVVATIGAPSTRAVAQSDWINPDVIALRDEVRRLDAQVQALLAGGGGAAASGAIGAAASPDSYIRLEQIELQLRSLTGRIERIEFDIRGLTDARAGGVEDLRFRLEALEERFGVTPPPPRDGEALARPVGPAEPREEIRSGGVGQSFGQGAVQSGVQGGGVQGGGQSFGSAIGSDLGASADIALGVEVDEQGRLRGSTAGGSATAPQTLGVLESDRQLGAVRQSPIYDTPSAGGGQATASATADEAYRGAVESVRSGAFDQAERQLRAFVDAHPSDRRVGDAKYWLGETHYVRGQFGDAARVFLDAYRQHPASDRAPDSLLKLGMTLAQLNQREEACLTFDEVLNRFPGAPSNVRNRAALEANRAGCG